MKRILFIALFLSCLFAQSGNDRQGTFISSWYENIVTIEDTSLQDTTQYLQDGRGFRMPVKVSKTVFNVLSGFQVAGTDIGNFNVRRAFIGGYYNTNGTGKSLEQTDSDAWDLSLRQTILVGLNKFTDEVNWMLVGAISASNYWRIRTTVANPIEFFTNVSGSKEIEIETGSDILLSNQNNLFSIGFDLTDSDSSSIWNNGTDIALSVNTNTDNWEGFATTNLADDIEFASRNYLATDTEMNIYQFKWFNTLLSDSLMADIADGKAVPYYYQGAKVDNQITDPDDSDLPADIGNWIVRTDGNGTCIWDAGFGGKVTVGGTAGTYTGSQLQSADFTAPDTNKVYRWEADVYFPAGHSWTGLQFQDFDFTDAVVMAQKLAEIDTVDKWQKMYIEFKTGVDVVGKVWLRGASTTTGDIFYFDNIKVYQVGLIAGYNNEGMRKNLWLDHSANNLHFNIEDGAERIGKFGNDSYIVNLTPNNAVLHTIDPAPALVSINGTFMGWQYLGFDDSQDEFVTWNFKIPDWFEPKTARITIYWAHLAGGTPGETVQWDVFWNSISDGGTIDQTEFSWSLNDVALGVGKAHKVIYDLVLYPLSVHRIYGGDFMMMRVNRDISEDNLVSDAGILNATMEFFE